MSALCQQRTSTCYSITSSARASSGLDHQPERLCGLEVDDEFELGRLYDRQVGGLLALEIFCGIHALQAIGIDNAGAVADEAACSRVIAIRIDRRNAVARCQSPNSICPVRVRMNGSELTKMSASTCLCTNVSRRRRRDPVHCWRAHDKQRELGKNVMQATGIDRLGERTVIPDHEARRP